MSSPLILVVEDNDDLREGLHEMLQFDGFSVNTARNGLEALEAMRRGTPDLILSDIMMPIMDGFSLLRAVRARPEWVTIPFVFLTARQEASDVLTGKNMGAEDYLQKPISHEELVTVIRSRLERAHQVEMAQLQQAYVSSLTTLANAIDQRDPASSGHVNRLTDYALAIARQLGWGERQQELLRYAAILHDIGKIHISETTLFKSTPLTQAEWEQIRAHPITGAEMIKNVPFLAEAAPMIRHHHEQWDGSGYPDGLTGEQIPEGSRILAIADAFDAMTSPHPYGPERPLENAYQEILRLAGKRYDPNIVEAFTQVWQSGLIQSIARRV